MQVDEIRRVLVIGAGTMGAQIALQCAVHGYDVTIHDGDADVRATVPGRLQALAGALLAGGGLDAAAATRALGRIAVSGDLAEAAADADLVSESIPEDPALKGAVFAALDAACPERTVFTTNTSTLLPSMFAEATGRPDRFAAFHFHTPVWQANVVDVMPHPGTATETVDLLVAFARRIGQIPIRLARENGGYVFNAIYSAINREALTLAANGVASVEDVDRAWMGIFKMPVGPFGMMDGVGLDTVFHITSYWAGVTGDAQLRRNADWLRAYVERGAVGAKAGEGFYRYPDPSYAQPGFIDRED